MTDNEIIKALECIMRKEDEGNENTNVCAKTYR